MHRIDGEGATADNKFTEGNPGTGVIATTVTADWCNDVQENLAAVVEAAGITLEKGNSDQLLAAIQSLISGGGVAVTAAGVSITDAGEYFSGAEVEAALQQIAAKVYAGKFNAGQIQRSLIALSGASHVMTADHAENIVVVFNASAATYEIANDTTLDLPVGTTITVSQSGAGKVTITAAAGVNIKCHSSFNPATMGQEASVVLIKTTDNTWRLGGMLEAA